MGFIFIIRHLTRLNVKNSKSVLHKYQQHTTVMHQTFNIGISSLSHYFLLLLLVLVVVLTVDAISSIPCRRYILANLSRPRRKHPNRTWWLVNFITKNGQKTKSRRYPSASRIKTSPKYNTRYEKVNSARNDIRYYKKKNSPNTCHFEETLTPQ